MMKKIHEPGDGGDDMGNFVMLYDVKYDELSSCSMHSMWVLAAMPVMELVGAVSISLDAHAICYI